MDHVPMGNEFTVRFPRDREELNQCFDLMQASTSRDTDLWKSEVVDIWEKQLLAGVGDVMIVENPAYHKLGAGGLPPFICVLCGSFLTEQYAKMLLNECPDQFIGMGLLKQCLAFKKRGTGIYPVATMEEIMAGQANPPDKGIRFATYLFIIHPTIEKQLPIPNLA
jgi:hypothetical protein